LLIGHFEGLVSTIPTVFFTFYTRMEYHLSFLCVGKYRTK
jgi:hypothetical protein